MRLALCLLAQASEWPLELDDECVSETCALQALQRQPWLYRPWPWLPPPAPTAPPAPRKSYVPLAPTGWGMIADDEGMELGRLATSKCLAVALRFEGFCEGFSQ